MMVKLFPETRQRLWFIAVIAAVLSLLPGNALIRAQQPSDPLILIMQGDLWSLTREGTLHQITTWGANHDMAISPDGSMIAYSSYAAVFMDWLHKMKGGGGFQPPSNIWIYDIPSNQTYRIADQPSDALWTGLDQPGKYLLRTSPVWSPDGQHLAWTEMLVNTAHTAYDLNGARPQLVVWDVKDRTMHVLDSRLTNRDTGWLQIDVKWGRPGIALINNPNHADENEELRVYNPSGGLISRKPYHAGQGMFALDWLHKDDASDYLFQTLYAAENTWINWRTGEEEPIPGSPEMYSLNAPNAASFFWVKQQTMLSLPGKAPIALDAEESGPQIPYYISRDGQTVAYSYQAVSADNMYYVTTIVIQTPNQTIKLGPYDRIEQVVWGPTGWRLRIQ